jgi:bifunctional non-homologous end joining protein LigD
MESIRGSVAEMKAKPAASARLPDFVAPMKAKLVGAMPSGGDWIYEIKFDGYRALALTIFRQWVGIDGIKDCPPLR